MRRKEERRRMLLLGASAIVFALGTMWGIGAAVLYVNPSSEVEKNCVNKKALDFVNCINEGWDKIPKNSGGSQRGNEK